MMVLRRTLAGYVGVPCYRTTSAEQPFGHVPFGIRCVALGVSYGRVSGSDPVTAGVVLWHNGASVGPSLTTHYASTSVVALDPTVDVDGVTEANVDGASRLGFVPSGGLDGICGSIGYEPLADADVGKAIMAVGSKTLAAASSAAAYPYALPVFAFGWPGGWGSSDSDIFNTPFELNDTGRVAGQVDAVAAIPCARRGTLQDFTLVERGGSGPDGVYRFYFRKNGADEILIETSASSQRVWTPTGATSLTVNVGDRINWRHEVASGTALDGELLWSFRAEAEGAALGGGESGGEF